MFPASACSGICRTKSQQFPSEFHDNLFVAQFNTRSVTRHVLSRNGSTFRAANADFLTTDDPDFRPADILVDADGSLLVLDTGSWYVQHCPTGGIRQSPARGAIYRVRFDAAATLADPWGLTCDWQNASTGQLVSLLADPRWAVREKASRVLVGQRVRAIGPLAAVVQTPARLPPHRMR